MEFLVFWIGTIITSFSMEIANELRMFKDAADAGYKIDIKRLSELGEQLNTNTSKNTLLSMLIPIFNIMQVLQRTIKYNNARSMILTQLSIMDCLEEMTEIEKEEYKENPTGLNAYIIPIKSAIKSVRNVTFSIEINDSNEQSVISYQCGESLDDITILKVTGDAAKLTLEEQKEKVIDFWKKYDEKMIEKLEDKENSINTLNNNTNPDVRDNTDIKKEYTLEQLRQEREFLVAEQQNQTTEYENTKGAYTRVSK